MSDMLQLLAAYALGWLSALSGFLLYRNRCPLGLHDWSIATKPIGGQVCFRCGERRT